MSLERVLERLEEDFDDHVEAMQALVRIPSVSADPSHAEDVEATCRWLIDRLEAAGLEHVERVPTSGHPAVIADWLHAGDDAPTVLIYGHYDVQPASKQDGWTHGPFDAVLEGDRVWGRGTTDDKGQLLCHVLAVEEWLKEGGPPVNVKFVFEGEEEVGSLHFEEVLDTAGDRLAADLLIVSDSPMRGENEPALTNSLRGLVYFQVDVQGPATDLHSGSYGGLVRNPVEALCHMLASCKDPQTGRILVPGFYDSVREPTEEERERLRAVAEPDQDILRFSGATSLFGEPGLSNAERVGLRPTFEINGLWGGYIEEGAKTIIPATAHAKLSCRIVADQDPAEVARQVEAHLLAVAPEGVSASVDVLSTGDAVYADADHPMVKSIEQALADTFGKVPALIPEGGSIPPVASMQKRLGVVPVLAGFGHRDENMHAPEESFRLINFRRGREASARILAALAQA